MGPLWTPSFITMALWLDAADSDTITEVSGAVSQWDDKSGNNRHATQGTPANRPVVQANAVNNLSAISFDGSDDRLNLDGLFGTSDISVTAISVTYKNSSGGVAYQRMYGSGSGSSGFAHETNGIWSTPGTGSNEVEADSTARVRGASNNNASRNFTRFKIGCEANLTLFYKGLICEIVVASPLVSAGDYQKLEGYLAHKWGLTANLPSDHPYKLHAPRA